MNLWHYNGTSSLHLLRTRLRNCQYWSTTTSDLFVSSPNEGSNDGQFLYSLSGTVGSTYAAVERRIPGIAFSAGNGTHRPFTAVSGSNDIAILNANVFTKMAWLANQLAAKRSGGRILPLECGINVNISALGSSCSSPKYVQSRLTGGASVDKAVLNESIRLFTYSNDLGAGANAGVNGDCSLRGESDVIRGCGCRSLGIHHGL